MARTTRTVEVRTCDLCGRELNLDDIYAPGLLRIEPDPWPDERPPGCPDVADVCDKCAKGKRINALFAYFCTPATAGGEDTAE